MERFASTGSLGRVWTDGPYKILSVWFSPDLQQREVLEKFIASVNLWPRRNLSLKGRAEMIVTYICPHILYRPSVMPLTCATLDNLEKAFFGLLWGGNVPTMHRELYCLYPSEAV